MEFLETILNFEEIYKKTPHMIAGVAVAVFWLWLAERQFMLRILNPHRDELEAILAKKDKANAVEAAIAQGAMKYGSTMKVGMAIFVAFLVCEM